MTFHIDAQQDGDVREISISTPLPVRPAATASCCGPSCCAEPADAPAVAVAEAPIPEATEKPAEPAEPLDLANTPEGRDRLKAIVREKYTAVVTAGAAGCCGTDCCDPDGLAEGLMADAYDTVDGYAAEADLKLGCGLPTEHARLAEGQTVLDLGAGAGIDAFVARKIVGDQGEVLGVDFTPAMVERARANAEKLGYDNVTFLHGDIEALPLPAARVDVVVSNCVLNLVPDKPAAFAEMYRVLRPGGHFCVSDIVAETRLPAAILRSATLYAGCVAGAILRKKYLGLLEAAGFEDVAVVTEKPIALPMPGVSLKTGLSSITVYGRKPDTAG